MAAEPVRARRVRSDFERNRTEILHQAEKHFSAHGVSASLEAVARDAGVGSATLYRHFPTREALLAALLEHRVTRVAAEQERISNLDDTAQALQEWLVALEDFFGAFDGLPDPLRSALEQEHNPLATTCIGFVDTTERFLHAAQEDGRARPDVRGRDLFLNALALSWVRGSSMADASSQQHLRDLARDGFATSRPTT